MFRFHRNNRNNEQDPPVKDMEEEPKGEDPEANEGSESRSTSVDNTEMIGSAINKEERIINWARWAVVLVLLGAAVIVGSLTYVFVDRANGDDFTTQWTYSSAEVITISTKNSRNVFKNVAMFSGIFPTVADESTVELPYATLKDFEVYAAGARNVSGALSLSYLPYIANDDMRAVWQPYSGNQSWWVGDQPFRNTIWKYQTDGDVEDAPENSAPYLPVWQTSPKPVEAFKIVNHDMATLAVYANMLQWILRSEAPMLSAPVTNLAGIFGTNLNVPTDQATSVLLQPVVSTLSNISPTIVGFISAVVSWNYFFDSALQEGQDGVIVVAESCGSNVTYQINGPTAVYVGVGDLHDPKYDSYVQTTEFADFGARDDSIYYCGHKLYIFPSDTMKASYSSNAAAVYTSIVVCVFVLAAVIFVTYDGFVRRRQRDMVTKASQNDELVQSLFPGQFGEKFLESKQALAKRPEQSPQSSPAAADSNDNNTNGNKDIAVIDTKDSLMKYVNDHSTAGKSETGAKPIAELFPEATVLFADIAGFTAWSSIREPSQVFTLLETIFGAFDTIANKRGVFKVETVGDCYVAVCGLPEPNKEHALVMARFARDCMEKVNEVIRELELTLGPDTAELAMRFGIHSGPVTAGVLRGDRARFQLFGDTVNTAARIESTGKRSRIHLSEQTASLIMATGRTNWVVERDDPVEAKGKGVMKTYWLLTLRNEKPVSSETGDTEGEAKPVDDGDFVPKSSFMDRIKAIKENRASKERRIQRLVQWNSEMLIQLLKQVVARRQALQRRKTSPTVLSTMAKNIGNGTIVVEEVAEIITLPEFDAQVVHGTSKSVQLPPGVQEQIHQYVGVVASMYKDNPFHNFEHASHVTMSVSKLLSRIVAPQIDTSSMSQDEAQRQAVLHDHTYGITSDPLTQFAVVLSALIHDVDHRGVPNFVLCAEDTTLAAAYKSKSVAEQNSVDLAWNALMSDGFEELRSAIFGDISELRRFRQLLVNSVIATDIFDKELGNARKARWDKAFSEHYNEDGRIAVNRKATIVIEHLIQASDVAHTMQHWHVYTKWNEKLFQEMHEAYRIGRSSTDPAINWYDGEIGFLDNYVIPLAKKLKNCGVFGVASDEYLNYVQENRREWASRGKEIVANYVEKYAKKSLEGGDAPSED